MSKLVSILHIPITQTYNVSYHARKMLGQNLLWKWDNYLKRGLNKFTNKEIKFGIGKVNQDLPPASSWPHLQSTILYFQFFLQFNFDKYLAKPVFRLYIKIDNSWTVLCIIQSNDWIMVWPIVINNQYTTLIRLYITI